MSGTKYFAKLWLTVAPAVPSLAYAQATAPSPPTTIDATIDGTKVSEKPQAEVKEIAIGEVPQALSVAPISVGIYWFPVVQTPR